ncbi:hypothetical protein GE09DRAFT_592537 [Coniochaeta sp. 2T2.1]|nr:hypothetical protein GE09DRAFT_592537 [Coniochaeta sp. 2T2.1]
MSLSRRMQTLIALHGGHPLSSESSDEDNSPDREPAATDQASESPDNHAAGQADNTPGGIVAKNASPDIIHSDEVSATIPTDVISMDQTAGPRDSRSPFETTEPDTSDSQKSDILSGPPSPEGTAPSSIGFSPQTPLHSGAHSEALEEPFLRDNNLGQDPSNVPPATDASIIHPPMQNPGTGDGDAMSNSPAPTASSASHTTQPAESSQPFDPTTDDSTAPTPRALFDNHPDEVQLANDSTVTTDNPATESPETSALNQKEQVIDNDRDPNDGALPPVYLSEDAWKARVYPIRDKAH